MSTIHVIPTHQSFPYTTHPVRQCKGRRERTHTTQRKALFTHGIALKGALEYLTPDSDGSWWGKDIGNCAAYGVVIKNGRFELPQEIITGIQ